MPCFRVIFLLLFAFFVTTIASAKSNFERASGMFQSGQFEASLELFLQETKNGNTSPQVIFNIASVYLKLKDYDNAKKYYLQLISIPNWRTTTEFYLGFIAEKNQDQSLAKYYFTRVSEQNQYPRLKKIAQARLIKSQPKSLKTVSPNTLLLSVRYGSDSNPIAISNAFQIPSSQLDDSFSEVMLFGRTTIVDLFEQDFMLQAYWLNRKYDQFNSLNTSTLNTGLFHQHRWLGWQFDKALNIYLSQLDGASFYRQVEGEIDLQKNFNSTNIRLAIISGYVDGQNQFNYLSGTTLKFKTEAKWQFNNIELLTGYIYDSNNRKGLETEENTFSYSPQSHSINAQLKWKYQHDVSFIVGASYTNTSYSGEDRLLDSDSGLKQAKRQSSLLVFYLNADYQLSSNLSLNFNFQSNDNSENFDLYSYRRNELSIGAVYHFY